ncbi:uncharacterized protein [Euwallacea fornicatus]|uniref:uncharacterized protein n=1 Tax=Euwallacea fornicatus TaxID=995702 RepID=UPI00338F9595
MFSKVVNQSAIRSSREHPYLSQIIIASIIVETTNMKHSVMLIVFLAATLNLVISHDEGFEEDLVKPTKKRRYLQDLPDKTLNKEQYSTEENEGEPLISIEAYCTCPRTYEPVCGSDGTTYNNMCIFNCENRKLFLDKKPGIAVVKNYPCEEEVEL